MHSKYRRWKREERGAYARRAPRLRRTRAPTYSLARIRRAFGMPAPHRIRAATRADAPALAALYADAFEDNPAYASVFQLRDTQPARHAEALAWLFERRAVLAVGSGCLFLLAEEAPTGDAPAPPLLAAAALMPLAKKPNFLAMIEAGVLEWPFRWGLPSLLRALALDGAQTGPVGETRGSEEPQLPPVVAELSMVAVRPDAQGRGIGGALLRELLARWDASGGGVVALGTQRARNLPFYARAGFVQTREWHAGGYTSWSMRRDAAPAAAAPPEPPSDAPHASGQEQQ